MGVGAIDLRRRVVAEGTIAVVGIERTRRGMAGVVTEIEGGTETGIEIEKVAEKVRGTGAVAVSEGHETEIEKIGKEMPATRER